MNKKTFLTIWLLILSISISAGQCPDDLNISFTSQAEVEAFAAMYPNCSEIHLLSIRGSDITSLESLHFLTDISRLDISSNDSLVNLAGLENINTTVSELWILNNPALEDISQLSGISGTLEILIIENNDALLHLTGLNNIQGLQSFWTIPVTIVDNDILLDLHGLEGLTYAEAPPEDPSSFSGPVWDVVIEDNDALQSLEGLGAITIPFDIRVENNNALPNLDGLQNQDSIKIIYIIKNDGLESLDGFKQGADVGTIHIEKNNSLVSLNGLDSLADVGLLSIRTNENLTDITSLPDFTDQANILDNDNLTGLSAFNGVTGENVRGLYFGYNDILTSLSPLQDIEDLRELAIGWNPSLENLDGLHNLEQLESNLFLAENESLNDISALSMLDTIGDKLTIRGNPSLESLLGFAVDTAHFTSVTIKDNLNLPVCEAVSICNFLQNFSEEENEVEIVNNAPGCNSRAEVEAACGIIGIDEVVFDSPLLKVSPNPAESFFEITLGQESQLPINDVRLFDGMGRLVYQNEPESLLHKIDTKNLPEGIYVVLVNGRYSEKLVIRK